MSIKAAVLLDLRRIKMLSEMESTMRSLCPSLHKFVWMSGFHFGLVCGYAIGFLIGILLARMAQ